MKKWVEKVVKDRLDGVQIVGRTTAEVRNGPIGEALDLCRRLSTKETEVYFIRCGEFVKIGYANSGHSRLRALQVANPYPCEVLTTVPGGFKLELSLHKVFKSYHHRGEWFRLDGQLAEFIGCVMNGKRSYKVGELGRVDLPVKSLLETLEEAA